MSKILFFLLLLSTCDSFGQTISYLNHRVNVLNYHVQLTLSDLADEINVHQDLFFAELNDIDTVVFDLVSVDSKSGKGMKVDAVFNQERSFSYSQEGELLIITGFKKDEKYASLSISYHGIPSDGLVISKNKFNDRTFFGDNWPNRAHHWFACNDYPSDKSKIKFTVIAPDHFKVIANGTEESVRQLENNTKEWIYSTSYELPTKVMVIGAADFDVVTFGPMNNPSIPVSAWVYPKDAQKGFYDMEMAPDILSWFERKIAAYPFDKLANVQSTTRYGGMENASCIFYDENAIDGKRSMETLIVHEIAHQWFGNSASEKDFSHLWLSEGFATYLTNVYVEETSGEEAFLKRLDKDRNRVISFNKQHALPVIDTLTSDLNQLLNANAYQKGSWVLHMLRMKLGDEIFWKAVKSYYSHYAFSNASSNDFEHEVEMICNCELDHFFDQWLRNSENPKLKISIKCKRKVVRITVEQLQKKTFDVDLEIAFTLKDLTNKTETIHLFERVTKMKLSMDAQVSDYEIDPMRKLLFEWR